jgi:hypothetical protein
VLSIIVVCVGVSVVRAKVGMSDTYVAGAVVGASFVIGNTAAVSDTAGVSLMNGVGDMISIVLELADIVVLVPVDVVN